MITGAGGFVGRWLLIAFRNRTGVAPAETVFALGRGDGRDSDRSGPVRWLRDAIDVTDSEGINALMRDVRPNCVLHLAAISTVDDARRDIRRTWDVNVYGTMTVAEATLRHAPDAPFIFASTSEVYGGAFEALRRPLDEGAPLDPVNPYAASKAAADLLVGQMARDGLRSIRMRPFNHTGPEQSERFVVPAFAAQVARIEAGLQEPVIRVGNLDARRDFLDVRDVVEAYALASRPEARIPSGTVINVASGEPRRIGDVLAALLARTQVSVKVEADPSRRRRADTSTIVGDARRAQALLGWTPTMPWDTTLQHILDYWRAVAAKLDLGRRSTTA